MSKIKANIRGMLDAHLPNVPPREREELMNDLAALIEHYIRLALVRGENIGLKKAIQITEKKGG